MTYPNGKVAEYSYNSMNRLVSVKGVDGSTTKYTYNALGQLTEFTRSDDISDFYAYDAVGNMLAKTSNGVKTKYTYNAANQLISDGANKYSYDANATSFKRAIFAILINGI